MGTPARAGSTSGVVERRSSAGRRTPRWAARFGAVGGLPVAVVVVALLAVGGAAALLSAIDAWPSGAPGSASGTTAVPPSAPVAPFAGSTEGAEGSRGVPAELQDVALLIVTVDADARHVAVVDLVSPGAGAPVRIDPAAVGRADVRPWGALVFSDDLGLYVEAGADEPTSLTASGRLVAGPDGPWVLSEEPASGGWRLAPAASAEDAGDPAAAPFDLPANTELISLTDDGAVVRLDAMAETFLVARTGAPVLLARGEAVDAGRRALVVRRCEPDTCSASIVHPDGSTIRLGGPVGRAVLRGASVVPSPDGTAAVVIEQLLTDVDDEPVNEPFATVIDLRTGGTLASWPRPPGSTTGDYAVWDPSGRFVVMADDGGAVVAHDTETGDHHELAVSARPPGLVSAVVPVLRP